MVRTQRFEQRSSIMREGQIAVGGELKTQVSAGAKEMVGITNETTKRTAE